jgi:hypothetical protein
MSDPASMDQCEQELANEIGRLRDIAVKSSDPLVVAKAIAVSHGGVQELILTRLRAGERLVEVFALQGTTWDELRIFCRFTAANELAHLVDSGLLAIVDAARGEVIGTIDPFILQPERRVGRPFVTISALPTVRIDAANRATDLLRDREQAFFMRLGLGQQQLGLGLGGFDTTCDTAGATSVTWSGTPYRPDKTDQETTPDYCDSPGPIIA